MAIHLNSSPNKNFDTRSDNNISTGINTGFLLTQQARDTNEGVKVSLWLKTELGPVELEIWNELAVFFVENHQVSQAKNLLVSEKLRYKRITPLTLKTFSQTSVTGFYFSYLKDFYLARACFKQHNIKCYEDDFRPDERYLMERFITASIDFIAEKQSVLTNSTNNTVTYTKYSGVKCKPTANYRKPELSMISIDLECSMDGELYSIGIYSDTCQHVFMIGEPLSVTENEPNDIQRNDFANKEHKYDYITWLKGEKQLLQHFITWLQLNDPDILIGWNVINFDMNLLQQRCDFYRIKFSIGRDGSSPYWRDNKNSAKKYVEIAGRVVLDGIDLLRTATYSFASFSLDFVANTLLGIGKKVEDVDNRLQEITDNFLYNKPALAAYNLEDCRLVWLIFEKTKLLEFSMLRAQLTGLNIDRVGGSVAAFTNLYLPKLHRSGYVAPNMGDGVSALVSPGGYVMDSVPGLYENVLVLDFKSLYPSIIRTFNIDPMGLIEGLRNVAQAPETCIEGFDGAYFSRTQHFLPDIIESLWQERDKAKQENNAALSQAIKIIMNSFYGVLGSTGCRFFDPRLSGAITKRSHQLLKRTTTWIEAKGYQVIYGDTDSIFVHVGAEKSLQESRQLGVVLQDEINKKWTQVLADEYNINSQLEIEFETHFSKFLMPTIRNKLLKNSSVNLPVIGTKKRYAGLIIENGEQKLVFKGLETVRSDWTELSKIFQQHLYNMVFNEKPLSEIADYIQLTVNKTLAGEFDHLLIYRKRLRRKLSDYVKNVPPHVKAARFADAINKKLNKPCKYQNKAWIEYYITIDGAQAKEHLQSSLDYDFYVDRQLKVIADDLLPYIGGDFVKIIDKQLDFLL